MSGVMNHSHGIDNVHEMKTTNHFEQKHPHTHSKAIVNRLSKAIGHLESVRKMVVSGRDCSEVLIQLSAVKAAINNTGKIILQDHIENCIVTAVKEGDHQAIEELNKAIDRFIK
jgi:DNA-binding FrmR family transcriptional regulator